MSITIRLHDPSTVTRRGTRSVKSCMGTRTTGHVKHPLYKAQGSTIEGVSMYMFTMFHFQLLGIAPRYIKAF